MAKMIGLVNNELIKTFRKLSTVVLCILIVLMCIGFAGTAKIAQKTFEDYDYYEGNTIDYDVEIEYLNESKTDGYELEIEKYQFMKANNIDGMSWKYVAAEEAFSYGINDEGKVEYIYSEEQRNQVKETIQNNDWKKYCQTIIAQQKALGMNESYYWEYQYRLDNDIPIPDTKEENKEWKNKVISSVSEAKRNLADGVENSNGINYKSVEKVGLYRLENNIEFNVKDSIEGNDSNFNCWTALGQSQMLVTLVGLFLMIVAGSIVSNEFSQGTIKFLLINPVKRWKILVAKYVTCILTGGVFVLLCYVLSVLSSGIFFGFTHMGADYIDCVNGNIIITSGLWYEFKMYLLQSVGIVVMATLAFAISSLLRSSSLAIGVSVFLLLSGSGFVRILSEFKFDWARYLIFANTDLVSISKGGSIFPNHTLSFAIGVIVTHMIVFFLIAWDGFTKREV